MKYIYLHGFASSPASTKARFFAARFAELGLPLEIPVLAPDFENLTLGGQIEIVSRSMAGHDSVTLIGSSMGGYVASLIAAANPLVAALVLMAPAFDLPNRMPQTLGGERFGEWRDTGYLTVYHYGEQRERKLSYRLVLEAEQYPAFPSVDQPALILHGTNDTIVPSQLSEEFTARKQNRKLVLLDSGHELADVLERLWYETAKFLEFSGAPVAYKIS